MMSSVSITLVSKLVTGLLLSINSNKKLVAASPILKAGWRTIVKGGLFNSEF